MRIPLLATSGAAWALLVANPHAAGLCSMPSMRTANLAGGSALMCAAMMLPAIGTPVRHVCSETFARRRLRSLALFITAYGIVWFAAGIALMLLAAALAASTVAIALAVVVAAAWQCSPWKQSCLNRCHNHPAFAAFGAAADRDALDFGITHGFWCAASCCPLMLLPMLVPAGHIEAMAAITIWIAGERLDRPVPPRWSLRWPRKSGRIAVGQFRVWCELPRPDPSRDPSR